VKIIILDEKHFYICQYNEVIIFISILNQEFLGTAKKKNFQPLIPIYIVFCLPF